MSKSTPKSTTNLNSGFGVSINIGKLVTPKRFNLPTKIVQIGPLQTSQKIKKIKKRIHTFRWECKNEKCLLKRSLVGFKASSIEDYEFLFEEGYSYAIIANDGKKKEEKKEGILWFCEISKTYRIRSINCNCFDDPKRCKSCTSYQRVLLDRTVNFVSRVKKMDSKFVKKLLKSKKKYIPPKILKTILESFDFSIIEKGNKVFNEKIYTNLVNLLSCDAFEENEHKKFVKNFVEEMFVNMNRLPNGRRYCWETKKFYCYLKVSEKCAFYF